MNRLNVAANDELAAGYHLVMLEGAALRDVAWAPGQTLRVAIGPTAINRSCTPIAWNPTAGRACIFGYARGTGGAAPAVPVRAFLGVPSLRIVARH